MKFKSRKLYAHGQNPNIFTLQIPKVVCEDMSLSKDTLVDIYYEGNMIRIEKASESTTTEETN